MSTPVPSVQLLSCLPFTVKLTTVPSQRIADLLPNLDQIGIDPELRDVLAAFELDIAHPLLFAVSPDETHGRQIRGPNISGHRKYWLLSELRRGALRVAQTLGEVGPYDCYLLDPAEETARKVLRSLGFQVRFGVSLEFAGSPPHSTVNAAVVPEFSVNDQRIVVPRHSPTQGSERPVGRRTSSV